MIILTPAERKEESKSSNYTPASDQVNEVLVYLLSLIEYDDFFLAT
jgi:hypothetical protein